MRSYPIAVEGIVSELNRIESWLNQSLGVATDGAESRGARDPFAPPDDLNNLKSAIDRIRPLLWVYLTRQNEAREANVETRKQPENVRTLMENALRISDRYVRKPE